MILTTAPAGRVPRVPLGISMTSQARLSVISSPALTFPLLRVVCYSVETVSRFPSSAACNVCQASVAHLTRTRELGDAGKNGQLAQLCLVSIGRRPARHQLVELVEEFSRLRHGLALQALCHHGR